MPHIEYEEDLDEVTAAVNAKEISPFIDLLTIIERDFNGRRVIKVELEKEDDYGDDDIWVYEIKMLDSDRNVVKAEFDAKTFRLLAIKGHKLERFFKRK
ncbi:PepSY domain-containing protein [Moritella sp. 24]|uniref:PepSY domain-containing protein n=1 Tax=Moritella sp. 24 TaxID=2746230 RepID=UPI002106B973|nr:PepSY domain-containing protein [Moritella sp. 24]